MEPTYDVPDEISAATARPGRRLVLKGAAVAGAGVWLAPVMTSMTPASAASAGCNCGGQNNCQIGNCGPRDAGCSCAVKTNGDCACFVPECGGSCAQDSDCPAGAACVRDCCGQPTCAPLCTGEAAAHAKSGRTKWEKAS